MYPNVTGVNFTRVPYFWSKTGEDPIPIQVGNSLAEIAVLNEVQHQFTQNALLRTSAMARRFLAFTVTQGASH